MISTGFHGSTFGGGMLQTRVSYNVLKSINKKAFLNKVKINCNFLSNLLIKSFTLFTGSLFNKSSIFLIF